MEQSIFTVTQLNTVLKTYIDNIPILQNVCVQGEISNYKMYPSGHHYFTLKDKECSLKCVMFRNSALKLRFRPENGMGVLAFGQVSVYPRDGAYQLYVSKLEPQGIGDLYLAFEQLKKKLEEKGLFDEARKKELPRFPKRVAVITSGAGAAVKDVIRVSGHRWPMAKIIVLPVRVQGKEAPMEIVSALRYANQWSVADLIIVGRGGGSIEDLWAFNDERVAEAIFASEIPVISAVGHEPDVTISDFVADKRAATPSNGAEIAVPDTEEIKGIINSLSLRAERAVFAKIDSKRKQLEYYSSRRAMQSPVGYIDQKRLELDAFQNELIAAQSAVLSKVKNGLIQQSAALDAMSPLKVLGRGYSISCKENGEILRSVANARCGEQIHVLLSDGKLNCTVNEIEARSNYYE